MNHVTSRPSKIYMNFQEEEEVMRSLRSLGVSTENGIAAYNKCGRNFERTLNYLMGVNERGEEIDFKDFNFSGFSIDKPYDE